MHRLQAVDQLSAVGRLERNAMLDEVEGCALQSLLDGFFGNQERACDLGVAEAAERLERHGNLVFAVQRRMAAGEDHPELAVLDRRVEEQVIDSRARRGAKSGPFQSDATLNLGAPERVENLVL